MQDILFIPTKKISAILAKVDIEFPKYTTQLINLANQNAQGTRPKTVGQMTDLIQEFPGKTYDQWVDWYLQKHPDAINAAATRIYSMIENLREAIKQIDEKMVETWVKDLVLNKTFSGLFFQEAILQQVAQIMNTGYRLATTYEEAQGIDGYIGDLAVSIKPTSYKIKGALAEGINCPFIYYEKKKDGISVDFSQVARDS